MAGPGLLLLSLLLTAPAAVLSAASVRSGFSDVLVASGLQQPSVLAFAPDGRLFVGEQTGKVGGKCARAGGGVIRSLRRAARVIPPPPAHAQPAWCRPAISQHAVFVFL
jgi:hypothetical protein